jgi:hypothetical protein
MILAAWMKLKNCRHEVFKMQKICSYRVLESLDLGPCATQCNGGACSLPKQPSQSIMTDMDGPPRVPAVARLLRKSGA